MVGIMENTTEVLRAINNKAEDMVWVNFTSDPQVAGFIPSFLSVHDPRPAKEQIADNYAHGGGWNSFKRHRLDMPGMKLHFPGDPPARAKAMTVLRDEVIILFEHDWLVIVQPDGEWDCARVD